MLEGLKEAQVHSGPRGGDIDGELAVSHYRRAEMGDMGAASFGKFKAV